MSTQITKQTRRHPVDWPTFGKERRRRPDRRWERILRSRENIACADHNVVSERFTRSITPPAERALTLREIATPVKGADWQRMLEIAATTDATSDPVARYAAEWLYEPRPIQVHGFAVCGELPRIANRIDQSRLILEHADDWDGEGSPRYDEATWRAAATIVVETANAWWRSTQEAVPVPAITEGPDGSIDVTWMSGTRQVLINVPPEHDGPATFSGLDTADETRTVKGQLGTGANHEWLIAWLTT